MSGQGCRDRRPGVQRALYGPEACEPGRGDCRADQFRGEAQSGWMAAVSLCWDDPVALAESMRGCRALINTYWVRFNSRWFSHAEAVEHTRVLFEAAAKAGVERIVHISITHPDRDSSLSYFRGKAELERMLESQDIPYSVLRPAVLFGERPGEDILINNRPGSEEFSGSGHSGEWGVPSSTDPRGGFGRLWPSGRRWRKAGKTGLLRR